MKEKEQLEENVTLGAISSELSLITNKVNSLRHSISVPFMSDDARQVGLGGIQKIIAAACTWNNSLIALIDRININELPILLGLPDVPIQETLNNMDGFLRIGIHAGCHFKTESLFYNLLQALGGPSNVRGFDNISKSLIERLTISEKEIKIEKLKVLGAIRNSYHNNGIHNNSSFSVTIKDRKYEFIKGKPVWCASIIDTLVVIEEYIDILSEILNSVEVMRIEIPIKDLFSSLVDPVTREEFDEMG